MISVNTNVAGLQSLSALENTTNQLSNATQELSTGLSINNPGDNPSGEAIVQTMTSQINGLNQAQQNAQNGLSVLQTAGGALSTVSNILQSLNTLAVTAANTATESGNDTALIQSQVTQLVAELDRMASTVSFNGLNLLDGSYTGENLQVSNLSQGGGASDPNQIKIGLSAINSVALGLTALNVTGTGATNTAASAVGTVAGLTSASTTGVADTFTINGASITTTGGETVGNIMSAINSSSAGVTASLVGGHVSISTDATGASTALVFGTSAGGMLAALGLTPSSSTTGTTTAGVTMTAASAIEVIGSALSQVATETGQIGATMDRLNYTVSNLGSEVQNTTAAQGTIQNVDMAAEMSSFTQLQILQQSGTAMLAQANQAPSLILKLIQ